MTRVAQYIYFVGSFFYMCAYRYYCVLYLQYVRSEIHPAVSCLLEKEFCYVVPTQPVAAQKKSPHSRFHPLKRGSLPPSLQKGPFLLPKPTYSFLPLTPCHRQPHVACLQATFSPITKQFLLPPPPAELRERMESIE